MSQDIPLHNAHDLYKKLEIMIQPGVVDEIEAINPLDKWALICGAYTYLYEDNFGRNLIDRRTKPLHRIDEILDMQIAAGVRPGPSRSRRSSTPRFGGSKFGGLKKTKRKRT
jgi:hypothetical protein